MRRTLATILMLAAIATTGGAEPGASKQTTSPEAWLAGLPTMAVTDYQRARYGAYGKDLQLALRAWMSVWVRSLRDPALAMVQLDYVGILCEGKDGQGMTAAGSGGNIGFSSQSRSQTQNRAGKAERLSSLQEARSILQAIRVRTREPQTMRAIASRQWEVEQQIRLCER